MNTHTFINEPQIKGLQEAMGFLYQVHDKKPIYNKLENHDMRNTWKNIANDYINILNTINSKKSVNRAIGR